MHCTPAIGRLALLACGVALATPAAAQSQKVGDPPEARNMRLVGHSDLQARSAYQPVIQHQGDRYIAYIGHHGGSDTIPKPVNPLTGQPEFNGTSIVDVTDPKNPKYLAHIPGLPGNYEEGGAQMVRVCDGKTLPKGDRNMVYLLRVFDISITTYVAVALNFTVASLALFLASRAPYEARTPAPAHVMGTSPSLPLEAYAGTYRNAIYGTMTVALSAHKAHVNLILSGSADAFDDPDGRLEGEGKTGRHLKVRSGMSETSLVDSTWNGFTMQFWANCRMRP